MTVWREEDLAAAHAGQKRLDRRDLIDGGFDHDEYAANRRMAEEAKRFYDLAGEKAVQALMDKGYTAKDFCTAATTGTGGAAVEHVGSTTEVLKRLVNMKPAVNTGRAYLVVPPDFKLPELQFVPFEEEQCNSRLWRHHWGDYRFGMPIIRSPIMSVNTGGFAPLVKDEPVLPRLVAEHVEPEKPKDLTFWQALIFMVGVGTILCLLGGAL